MFAVLLCITQEHDLRLVLVAAVICATACSASFGFHLRAVKAPATAMRWAWMALTGLVAGSGVWATHFIAMLAYQPNLPMGYDIAGTAVSLATAVIGMGVGFALPVVQRRRGVVIGGGVVTGLSVAAMHFMGIAAVRAQADIGWNYPYVWASLVIGALGAAAAFYACSRLKGRAQWVGAAGLLVLGIVGLHFTAMTAVRLEANPGRALPAELVGRGALALATVILAAVILAAASSLIWMERQGRRSTLRGLRDALDAVSSGLAFYDPAGRLLAWNHAYGRLMKGCGAQVEEGTPRMELAAAALAAGWQPQSGVLDPERRRAYLNGGRVEPLEMALPDGRWIRHEAFSTHDGGGVTVMTDITDQHERARALAEARDAAEAANRAKSLFLANMSHEIRTPLNGVLGVADLLAASDLDPRQRELVDVIQTSGGLLNALLTDLLDLARVEAGAAELRPEPTDVGALVATAVRLFAARAEQKGLTLRAEVDAGAMGWVACDAIRLRQVLGNLISNAVKFTEAGEVVLAVTRDGGRLSFQVRDTGVGFDAVAKARLFGRFQLGDDSATRKHGGAGLGLAICQEYVRLMGGELDCVSQPGAGSTFAFSLELPALDETPLERPAVEAPLDGAAGSFRVLVVDDNAVNRQVLGLILDSVGIAHDEAENGRDGVEAATAGGFDAVLMDIQMPVMDGLEATRRIRGWESDRGRAPMPIYIVSANCLQEHVEAGMAAGADGHIAKPVSVAQLVGALQPHAVAKLAA
jgi:signal transduction histidine kinase/ActR/RegA family two-component response regulator